MACLLYLARLLQHGSRWTQESKQELCRVHFCDRSYVLLAHFV